MSLAVSWLPSGALGCEDGGAVAATRCGAGGASSACAACSRVRFFSRLSNDAGCGRFSSRFLRSLSNALGSGLVVSERGAWDACCGSGFGLGSGGCGGGGSGVWASTGLGGGGGGTLTSGLAGSGGAGSDGAEAAGGGTGTGGVGSGFGSGFGAGAASGTSGFASGFGRNGLGCVARVSGAIVTSSTAIGISSGGGWRNRVARPNRTTASKE